MAGIEQSQANFSESNPKVAKNLNPQLLMVLAMIWATLAIYTWHSWDEKQVCVKSLSQEPGKTNQLKLQQ